ncbi:MAG: M23 family metallopeptidase [Deltaproteobacteria bacterium]|nr:M23 family metallopeptidase [Deltaproteobacteria bacterium]MBW2076303.1 M23 family metallopeptidase [Deltaproteobacteria bacterium]MBW2311264.1 M23 family metallopeptidase [Deltaproteobacteria bacterium]
MASKKATLVFLPGGSSKVRKVKIPSGFLRLFLIIFVLLSIGICWLINDYKKIKAQIPRLNILKKENRIQKTQLAALIRKINKINKEMMKLQEFDQKLRIMTNLNPSEKQEQFLGLGGSNINALNTEQQNDGVYKELIYQTHKSLENLETEIAVTSRSQAELSKFLREQKSILACTPSIRPTNGWFSSGFGYRISPFTNLREFHKGLDIATRIGTPIIAPADGLVVFAGREGNFGRMIAINHGYNLMTRYGHLHKFCVRKGQHVKRGQVIGEVGSTGRCTGPHLHYEVLLNGVPVNPLRYILN